MGRHLTRPGDGLLISVSAELALCAVRAIRHNARLIHGYAFHRAFPEFAPVADDVEPDADALRELANAPA
jgi:hypothetical protein